MSYRVKRVDAFWISNPVVPVVAIVGVVAAIVLLANGMVLPAFGALLIGGGAIVVGTSPAVTAVVLTLGLFGGIARFLILPTAADAAAPFAQRLLSAGLYTAMSVALGDGGVLLICVLYNWFAGVVGLGGLSLDLEEGSAE